MNSLGIIWLSGYGQTRLLFPTNLFGLKVTFEPGLGLLQIFLMNLLVWPNKVTFEPGYRSPPNFCHKFYAEGPRFITAKANTPFQKTKR